MNTNKFNVEQEETFAGVENGGYITKIDLFPLNRSITSEYKIKC